MTKMRFLQLHPIHKHCLITSSPYKASIENPAKQTKAALAERCVRRGDSRSEVALSSKWEHPPHIRSGQSGNSNGNHHESECELWQNWLGIFMQASNYSAYRDSEWESHTKVTNIQKVFKQVQ